ncbi:hypothetical protein HMPREF9156_00851 [Scardovia wiggsiae F0424]|uniref:Uncharacterized protein n=1 Tax=Scardovia wiggsiae F0424 TaxID=857290 RepID=J0X0S5_9BIFI|nr:hypothetical protein HMPREF9156_00851 [Scardovia wiggsiae F0424]
MRNLNVNNISSIVNTNDSSQYSRPLEILSNADLV